MGTKYLEIAKLGGEVTRVAFDPSCINLRFLRALVTTPPQPYRSRCSQDKEISQVTATAANGISIS